MGQGRREFILSVFDRHQWCPVLQTRFVVDDLDLLKSLLGDQAKDDPELRGGYLLTPDETASITTSLDLPVGTENLHG